MLSQPAVHIRFVAAVGGCDATSPPAGTAGAQDTAVTPIACALPICTGNTDVHNAGSTHTEDDIAWQAIAAAAVKARPRQLVTGLSLDLIHGDTCCAWLPRSCWCSRTCLAGFPGAVLSMLGNANSAIRSSTSKQETQLLWCKRYTVD